MSVLIFAGTSEGREIAAFLSARGMSATVCVATEYGETVLPALPGITVLRGRMDETQMRAHMSSGTLVIDATHPYAAAVTANIRAACGLAGCAYLRLVRPRMETDQPVVTVPDAAAAAAYLNTVTGSALLTTGSKELEAFTAVNRYAERLWPRVLPTATVLQKCEALGFPGAHIIAMQGPFSREMNAALLRQTRAKYLVTKDTGAAGGFAEKMEAARAAGTTVVLIARPVAETGYTLREVKALLSQRFNLTEPVSAALRFPLFVSLQGRRAVVFGAGRIAARRVEILRRFGAAVTVVAPAQQSGLSADIARGYQPEDLKNIFLAVAATDNRAVNHQIAQDCLRAGILCSVADCAEESTFFFPAVCTAGNLVAGIVSDGGAHAATAKAAARVRAVLEEETGDAHENH